MRRARPRSSILTGGIVLGLAGAVGSERFAAPFAILLVLVPAWRLCYLRLAAGDARPDHADGVRESQHRAPRRRRRPRHSLHRHRFQGADAGYPGQARGSGGIARRHRDPDRGTRRGDAASGASDDGVAAVEFGAARYCRGVCRAGCRCGAGHAILRHCDRGRSHHRLDGGRAARPFRIAGARRSQFRRGVAGQNPRRADRGTRASSDLRERPALSRERTRRLTIRRCCAISCRACGCCAAPMRRGG